ncbi:hypothetical protein HYU06_02500 [Candidatus Woesearchaeota archaeon]|nr:hypothetical protein [Candidatus Woesearchaeota archaeon]
MTIDAVVERKVERVADSENLLNNLGLIDAATWETSQEVFKAWQNGATDKGVYTANLAVYRLENGEAVFELLGREGNPFMDEAFRVDAYNGIRYNKFFFPQGEMKKLIISAKPLVTVRYSGLILQIKDCGENYGYVEFNGKNTAEEKKLFKGVYGTELFKEVDGTDNHGNGKRVYRKRVDLLRESVVKAQLEDKADEVIVRTCYFYYGRNFIADDRYVVIHGGAVRGVRLGNVAEDDGQTNVQAERKQDFYCCAKKLLVKVGE